MCECARSQLIVTKMCTVVQNHKRKDEFVQNRISISGFTRLRRKVTRLNVGPLVVQQTTTWLVVYIYQNGLNYEFMPATADFLYNVMTKRLYNIYNSDLVDDTLAFLAL